MPLGSSASDVDLPDVDARLGIIGNSVRSWIKVEPDFCRVSKLGKCPKVESVPACHDLVMLTSREIKVSVRHLERSRMPDGKQFRSATWKQRLPNNQCRRVVVVQVRDQHCRFWSTWEHAIVQYAQLHIDTLSGAFNNVRENNREQWLCRVTCCFCWHYARWSHRSQRSRWHWCSSRCWLLAEIGGQYDDKVPTLQRSLGRRGVAISQ